MTAATQPTSVKRSKWRRRLRNLGIVVLLLVGGLTWASRDHLRTLRSLTKVEGTNVYVIDYYADYDMDEIRRDGMDIDDIEGTCIDALFPEVISPIARIARSAFVPDRISTHESQGEHHCSSVARDSEDGRTWFGRNFDSPNDALLFLRVYKGGQVDSISVIDLAYLNLNRSDLLESNLIRRIPLLFSPYYVMDGMNRHGLAVSAMSVPEAKSPKVDGAPHVTQASMMRLLLDYCKSVDEAVDMLSKYNIAFAVNPEHLMLADSTGEMVVVEFLGGEMRLIESTKDWLVCTNHILWSNSPAENNAVCDRYMTGTAAMDEAYGKIEYQSFSNAVRSMSVDNWTMWTSIYDLDSRTASVIYKARTETEFEDQSMAVRTD